MHYVYILQSRKNDSYYIGVTKNARRRIREHNSGLSKSTAPYRPYVLLRVEKYHTSQEAYKRERFLKSKKSKKIIELVIKSSPDVLA